MTWIVILALCNVAMFVLFMLTARITKKALHEATWALDQLQASIDREQALADALAVRKAHQ